MRLHAVHFYRDDCALCTWIARIVIRGLAENQPAIVMRPQITSRGSCKRFHQLSTLLVWNARERW